MTARDDELLSEVRELVHRMIDARSDRLNGEPPPVGWQEFADAGLLGLEAPEACGGADATFAETAAVVEELGRAAAKGPYLGSSVLGLHALLLAGEGPARDQLVAEVASGAAVISLCLSADDEAPEVALPFRIDRSGPEAVVVGEARDVLDAPDAGRLIALADDGSAPVLVVLSPDDDGVAVERQPAVDVSRSLGRVRVDRSVDGAAIWPLERADGLARLRDRAALAVAVDSVGITRAALERTVAYVGDRHQFGRPIGSFQAVKHLLADVAVALAASQELVEEAVDRVVADDPAASSAVAMAASHACETAVHAAGTAMQLHGGIGYTWEGSIHLFLKRAVLNRSMYGSPRAHRARLAASLGERHPQLLDAS